MPGLIEGHNHLGLAVDSFSWFNTRDVFYIAAAGAAEAEKLLMSGWTTMRDIGGPAMTRAAAKNHDHVTVVVDPGDYQRVLDELSANDGATSPELRRELAAKAFARTAAYDAAVSNWLLAQTGMDTPLHRAFAGTLRQVLRYGENPHQQAAFYASGDDRPGVATARTQSRRSRSTGSSMRSCSEARIRFASSGRSPA